MQFCGFCFLSRNHMLAPYHAMTLPFHHCYGFPVCCMSCVTIYGLLMRTHEASLNSLLLTEPPCCMGCVVLK